MVSAPHVPGLQPIGCAGPPGFPGADRRHPRTRPPAVTTQPWQLLDTSLAFCIPNNKELRGYWDLVEGRLANVRNCRDIDGKQRVPDLSGPSIDPHLLLKLKAAGLTLDDVMNVTSGNVPVSNLHEVEAVGQLVRAVLSPLPDIGAPTAMKYGGVATSGAASGFALAGQALAQGAEAVSASAGLEATFQRRDDDWKHQAALAQRDVERLKNHHGRLWAGRLHGPSRLRAPCNRNLRTTWRPGRRPSQVPVSALPTPGRPRSEVIDTSVSGPWPADLKASTSS